MLNNNELSQKEFDIKKPHGKLLFQLMASLAEYERELILERQKEGIQRAKIQGKYKGRKKFPLPDKMFFENCYNKYQMSTRFEKYSLNYFQKDINHYYRGKKNGRFSTKEISISKSTLCRWIKLQKFNPLYENENENENTK